MPLSIDSYTQWAALNTNTEAALSKGAPGLDRASNQVGVLARFFGTKSAQNVRKAVIEDFTRAPAPSGTNRSEERRVGTAGRSRWSPHH